MSYQLCSAAFVRTNTLFAVTMVAWSPSRGRLRLWALLKQADLAAVAAAGKRPTRTTKADGHRAGDRPVGHPIPTPTVKHLHGWHPHEHLTRMRSTERHLHGTLQHARPTRTTKVERLQRGTRRHEHLIHTRTAAVRPHGTREARHLDAGTLHRRRLRRSLRGQHLHLHHTLPSRRRLSTRPPQVAHTHKHPV